MRPLLPALAAPFTETTTDEHESMCLSLSLLSSSLLFHHSPPLFIPLPFISFRLLAKNSHRLCHSPCFSPPSYSCFHCPPPCQPSRLVEISIFSGACVCTSRGDARCSFLTRPFLFCQALTPFLFIIIIIVIVILFFNPFISLYTFFPFSYCTF